MKSINTNPKVWYKIYHFVNGDASDTVRPIGRVYAANAEIAVREVLRGFNPLVRPNYCHCFAKSDE